MSLSPTSLPSRWELAAEAIAVKIRWFGILFGYLIVSFGAEEHRDILSAILALGVVYAGVDTAYSSARPHFPGSFPWSSRGWSPCSSAFCATTTRGSTVRFATITSFPSFASATLA
ncbi:MAG: hypothetical protein U0793_16460 [Gemmataceae bacterium]